MKTKKEKEKKFPLFDSLSLTDNIPPAKKEKVRDPKVAVIQVTHPPENPWEEIGYKIKKPSRS